MRLAVLDLGLDSLHLAVFEAHAGGPRWSLVGRRSWSETVHLAAGMEDARLSEPALSRARSAVERLLGDLAAFDRACPLVAIASAALGSTDNGADFIDHLRWRHGLAVELLSPEAEARLSYLGARSYVGTSGRLAVADLGSGSLELATGAGPACDLVYSVPLAELGLRDIYLSTWLSTRLHPERRLDRAARERVAAMVRFAADGAARAVWDRRPDCLAFTSGTAHALGTLADELGLRPPGASALGLRSLARLADILAQFQPIELPALGVEEARSDTVAVGAVVLHTMMELLGTTSAVISPCGRREGAALHHLLRGGTISTDDRVHTAVT
jgi:exopolyphosphatase / guanosine-5'-triphosphate,3'-diphosphate pyrophosphatase